MGKKDLSICIFLHLFCFFDLFFCVFVLLFFALFLFVLLFFLLFSRQEAQKKAKQKQRTANRKSKINAKKMQMDKSIFSPFLTFLFFPFFCFLFFSVLKFCFLMFHLFSLFFAFFSNLKIIRRSYRAEHKFSIQHLGEEEIMLFLTGRNNSIARNWPKQHESVAAAPNFEPNAFRFARPNWRISREPVVHPGCSPPATWWCHAISPHPWPAVPIGTAACLATGNVAARVMASVAGFGTVIITKLVSSWFISCWARRMCTPTPQKNLYCSRGHLAHWNLKLHTKIRNTLIQSVKCKSYWQKQADSL